MTRKTLYADDVKAAIEKLKKSLWERRWACAFLPEVQERCKTMEVAYNEALAAIDSLPAAEPDAGERMERPPMLLVGGGMLSIAGEPQWWIRHGDVWRRTNGAEISSDRIRGGWVDRTASDEAALRLYDQDLAAFRPATP